MMPLVVNDEMLGFLAFSQPTANQAQSGFPQVGQELYFCPGAGPA